MAWDFFLWFAYRESVEMKWSGVNKVIELNWLRNAFSLLMQWRTPQPSYHDSVLKVFTVFHLKCVILHKQLHSNYCGICVCSRFPVHSLLCDWHDVSQIGDEKSSTNNRSACNIAIDVMLKLMQSPIISLWFGKAHRKSMRINRVLQQQ